MRTSLKAISEAMQGNFVSEEEKKKRMDICNAPCEFRGVAFDESKIAFGFCKVCKCPIKTRTALKNINCPKNFW